MISPAQRQRAERINKLKSIFETAHAKDVTISEKKLKSELFQRWGCTERLVDEYLRVLLNSEFIRKTDDMLYLNKDYNASDFFQEIL